MLERSEGSQRPAEGPSQKSAGLVTGLFDDQEHARNAIEALKTRKFEAKAISLAGCDSDEFRDLMAPLVSNSPDRFAVIGTIVGAFVGLVAAFYAIHELGWFTYFLAIGPLMAAISGAVAGGIIGLILVGLVHFDTVQYDAQVFKIEPRTNEVFISVDVMDKDELDIAEAIMQERGALEVRTKLAPAPTRASSETEARTEKEEAKLQTNRR